MTVATSLFRGQDGGEDVRQGQRLWAGVLHRGPPRCLGEIRAPQIPREYGNPYPDTLRSEKITEGCSNFSVTDSAFHTTNIATGSRLVGLRSNSG